MTGKSPEEIEKESNSISEAVPPSPSFRNRHTLNQGLLFLATFCLLAYHLGSASLFETSEGRYGSVARTMLESGDWMTPRLNGLIHFTKPPLTYWVSAWGMKILGVNETGAKAFLPVAGGLTVIGCYQIGLLFFTARAALCASFVLMTSAMFLGLFRGLTPDPLLTLFETWMIWAFLAHARSARYVHSILFWLFASLAMLTKGPPAFLPLLGLFPLLWFSGYKSPLRKNLRNALGWGIFLVVGLGWYLEEVATHQGLWDFFLLRETVERVASDVHDRGGPWYYFLVVLLVGSFPWTPFLVETIWEDLLKIRKERQFSRLTLLVWIGLPFLILSLSHSKLATYSLPLFIPCSLLIGDFLSRRLHIAEDEPFTYQMGAAVTLVILCVGGLALLYTSLFDYIPNLRVAKLGVFLALYFVILSIFGYMFMYLRFGKGVIMVLGITIPGFLFFSLPSLDGTEEFSPGKFLRGARPLLKRAGELPTTANVVCVEDMLESMTFYAGRPFPTWEVKRETRFDEAAGKIFDLHGDEALRNLGSGPLFLLARKKDVPKVQGILGKWLKPLETCGLWGLYETGDALPQESAPATIVIPPASFSAATVVATGSHALPASSPLRVQNATAAVVTPPGKGIASAPAEKGAKPSGLTTPPASVTKPLPNGNAIASLSKHLPGALPVASAARVVPPPEKIASGTKKVAPESPLKPPSPKKEGH